jgi:hypothetical protein
MGKGLNIHAFMFFPGKVSSIFPPKREEIFNAHGPLCTQLKMCLYCVIAFSLGRDLPKLTHYSEGIRRSKY